MFSPIITLFLFFRHFVTATSATDPTAYKDLQVACPSTIEELLRHAGLMSSQAGLVCPLGDPSPRPVLSSGLPGGLCGPVLHPPAGRRAPALSLGNFTVWPGATSTTAQSSPVEPLQALSIDWLIDWIKGGSHHLKGLCNFFFSTRLKQNLHSKTGIQNCVKISTATEEGKKK